MLLSYRHPDFWKKFQQEHWKPRIPTVIRNPFREFLFSENMVLRAMKGFHDRLETGDTRIRHMASLGKAPGDNRGALRRLFRCDNNSMAALEANVSRLFPNRDFGIMVNNLQSIEPGIWNGVARFLQDAYPWVDFPVARTVLDLFFGSYSHSFLGLHKDTQEIFAFIVRGEKTILAWPFEYFTSRVKGLSAGARFFQTQVPVDYRKYRKDALVLQAQPGDVIYWPSEYWHIAEGERGDFATMLSLGLFLPQYVNPKRTGELNRFREKLLAGQSGSPLHSQPMSDVARGPEGNQRLRWATGFGFQFGGPVTDGFLRHSRRGLQIDSVKKREEALLLWKVDPKAGRMLVSTNGYSVSLPPSDAAIQRLEGLARGESVAVTPTSRRKSHGTVRAILWNPQGEMKTRAFAGIRDPAAWLMEWLISVQAVGES